MIINDVHWLSFSDNIKIERHKNYVFMASVENYYSKIDAEYLNLLSVQELTKAARYRQETDRKQFITARYLLRNILSKLGLAPAAGADFEYAEFNKPYIEGIEFNISHSGDCVVVAISSQPIGIDVELINYDFDYTSIIPTIFDADEIAYISTNKTIGFYTLWTRKEALLKATGEGLIDNIEELNCLNNVQHRNNNYYFLNSFKTEHCMASLAISNSFETMFLHLH